MFVLIIIINTEIYMNYLVSYNHSGNTWVRYCVEYITKKPTYGHRKYSISQRALNFLDIDVEAHPVLIKRHTLDGITDQDNFVLLLRDPRDCIKEGQDVHKEFLKYYSLIKGYEAHKGPKSVIYYNDVFDKKSLGYILSLFGISISDYIKTTDDLLENWAKHKGVCLNVAYNNETNALGADLSLIPKIFLEHELIKNTGCTVYL